MCTVGYLPYFDTGCSAEAGWLAEHLSVAVQTAHGVPSLNDGPPGPLVPLERMGVAVQDLIALPAVVAEGPGGFLWAAVLRAHGFAGTVTILPYLNPRRWYDVAAAAVYLRFAIPGDRVFLGSTPSAAIYRGLGVMTSVGEPYGIDDALFGLRPGAARTRTELAIPAGPLLLFTGRAQPDKDLYRLLRVALKARLLFPSLQVVIASHVVDREYLATAREQLDDDDAVHFVVDPTPDQLADLYNVADVYVTVSTSHFETFGRSPAEALACGSPAVAPCYDGFAEVLAQPGGRLVAVDVDSRTGTPLVSEEALLRAIYDVLSSPHPPRRREVATTARQRFGRSSTIGLLRYLVDGDPRQPATTVPSADIPLPDEWRRPLAEISDRDGPEALSWFWDSCDHSRFSVHDDDFAAQVRRSLCVPTLPVDERARACP